ncbi:MAG: hypothetical protein IPG45_26915 [Deltaproteobacteria bacterium]|nr:hypothetical protein [Deltaproteobacteria bacterium]
MKAQPPGRPLVQNLAPPDLSPAIISPKSDAFSGQVTPATSATVHKKPSAAIQKLKEAEGRPYLHEVAKVQWEYYADQVNAGTNFLPPDNIRMEAGRALVVDPRTSPTNIGLYMLATATAKELGLIGEREMLLRLRQTVDTIKNLPKYVTTTRDEAGREHPVEHLYNWYGIQGQPTEIGNGFISTVDNGNFVAFLMAVLTAIKGTDPALEKDLLGLVEKMRFDVFYDRDKGLLHHGGQAKDGRLDLTGGHYDLIITEARCAYAAAIMLGQIPKTAWTNMKRKLVKEIDDISVNKSLDLQSYTGTMFEYLTPRLLMKHEGTPLGVADEQAVKIQMRETAGGIWGRSEANSNTTKGYAAWGARGLSLSKEFTGAGHDIIAPYACQMATGMAPIEVADNLKRMEAHGLRGRYGFFESGAVPKDGGKVEVVPQFFAHHIGMGFVGIANYLKSDVVTDWFHGSSFNDGRALEGLLDTPVAQYQQPALKKPAKAQSTNAYAYEAPVTYNKAELVGNTKLVSYVAPVGSSTWMNQNIALSHNESVYVRDNQSGALLPLGRPIGTRTKNGARSFEYQLAHPSGPISLTVEVSTTASGAKLTRARIDNRTGKDLDLAITGTLDWILDDINGYLNHPVYRNLYVETELDPQSGAILARRRTAQGAEQDRQPFGFFAVAGKDGAKIDWAEGSRTELLGRLGSLAAPKAVVEGQSKQTFGVTLDPSAALSKSIKIGAGKKGEVAFLFDYAETKAEVTQLIRGERKNLEASKPTRKASTPHYPSDAGHSKMLELAKRTRRNLAIKSTAVPSMDAAPSEIGHWSKDGRTFTIDNPFALKKPWSMVASNGDFGFVATAAGWGYSFGTNSQQNRITPYVPDNTSELPLRGVVVKNKKTGESWSIAPNPAPTADGKYSVEMSPGQIKYRCSREDGLSMSLTMSVAAKDPVELWKIEVDNQSRAPVELELSSFLKWALGASYPNTEAQNTVRYDEKSGAIYASSTDSIHPGSVAFHAVVGEQGLGKKNDLYAAPDDPFSGLSKDLAVGAGGKKTITFVLGQAPSAEAASKLVAKYNTVDSLQKTSAVRAAEVSQTLDSLQVSTPDPAINTMLNTWLPYQAYHAHFLARSGYYQSGGAYGFRDQLQTVMNLLDTGNPKFRQVARDHLLESCRHQFESGAVQHWWHPHNNLGQQSTISDNLLWLPYALEHYLDVTGDQGILAEKAAFSVPSRDLRPGELDFVESMAFSENKATMYDHAKRAIDLVIGERMGEHGLPLIGKGDWNDGLDRVGHLGKGESVWLGFFLFDVLSKFAGIAEKNGDAPTAERYRGVAAKLKEDLAAHGWDGKQFLRAYADSGEKIDFNDAIVQSWAALSGGADKNQAITAVRSAVESLYKPDANIILLFDRVLDKEPWGGSLAAYPNGLRENNAQYTHGSSWLPRAVAQLGDGDLAMELYKALLPNTHAEDPRYGAEPYVVAADIYGGKKAGEGGWTWYSGGPGWIYRTGVEKILGLQFKNGDQLVIDPTIPRSWPGFSATHQQGASTYQIEVKNPDGLSRGVASIKVDGRPVDPRQGINLKDDGRPHRVEVLMGAVDDRPDFRLLPNLR